MAASTPRSGEDHCSDEYSYQGRDHLREDTLMAFWYIDALDPRAGMGLATYREPDLNTDTVDLGRPAVFIGPPFFQAESVASRAIGFAATRGSFQLGLFSGDDENNGEIAFSSLQGVCEFIR